MDYYPFNQMICTLKQLFEWISEEFWRFRFFPDSGRDFLLMVLKGSKSDNIV